MATQNVQVFTGNRIIVMMNNVQVGVVQTLRASDDYGPQEVSGVGDIHVIEWAPTIARHSLNCSVLQLRKKSLISLGIAAENGDDVLKGNTFDIVVMTNPATEATSVPLVTYRGCSFASGDVEITKHAIVSRSATFMALDRQGQFVTP